MADTTTQLEVVIRLDGVARRFAYQPTWAGAYKLFPHDNLNGEFGGVIAV